ncbi:uncharacterized protein LOC119085709 [Bradysia coprophila]|uniref:uncharacterized protein LOC119085709 n=1 Tax=Bradysia coprophila TaxID=38358 RepID=UPI00187D8DFA|nr:uncharacterized protein LOC119085709 [Bradysia coprophila]
MLNQKDNSRMYIEGETAGKHPIDGLNTLNNRINGRNYNDGEDISKSSLVSDELNTLKTDLYNATKSLEKSLSMAEGLKESLRNVAVDKQILAMRLHETQTAYEKLRRHAMEQRKCFRNKTNQMQYEIDEVKNSLAATKMEFFNTNAELRRNLRSTIKTTNRLSLMFLRMKETKNRVESKKTLYERISNDLSGSIKEQANIIKEMAKKCDKSRKTHSNIQLLNRVGQLLSEVANLRLKLAAEIIAKQKQSKKITDKLIDRVASKLAKERYENDHFEHTVNSDNSINSSIDLDDSEVTIFQQNCKLKRSNSF